MYSQLVTGFCQLRLLKKTKNKVKILLRRQSLPLAYSLFGPKKVEACLLNNKKNKEEEEEEE